jgi:hypothetical protein
MVYKHDDIDFHKMDTGQRTNSIDESYYGLNELKYNTIFYKKHTILPGQVRAGSIKLPKRTNNIT